MPNTSFYIRVALEVSIAQYACSVVLVAYVLLHDCEEVVYQERRRLRRRKIAVGWVEGKRVEGEVAQPLVLSQNEVAVSKETAR